MKAWPTSIAEVLVLEPKVFEDKRGWFYESWSEANLRAIGVETTFVQDNHSWSRNGVLRGLHYQIEQAQGKLLRVVAGEIFDVAVDLRRSSPTFGQWVGVTLSSTNRKIVWVPSGFAHGFLVMSKGAEVLYKVTDFYSPAHERVLRWDDPTVGIRWPLSRDPTLSDRDARGTSLREAELYP